MPNVTRWQRRLCFTEQISGSIPSNLNLNHFPPAQQDVGSSWIADKASKRVSLNTYSSFFFFPLQQKRRPVARLWGRYPRAEPLDLSFSCIHRWGGLSIWQHGSDPPATAQLVPITYKSLLVCWLQQRHREVVVIMVVLILLNTTDFMCTLLYCGDLYRHKNKTK